MYNFNELQTPLSEELLYSLTQEEHSELLDYLNNVQFIQNLISPDRKRAKDLPRDEKGRIIVDICNPHITENMDYFRQTAIHYEKHGCFTKLRPNSNPNSEFGKWFNREVQRCWEGMVRPEDGEWITGKFYFYLNYSPIMMSRIIPGTKVAERITGFPECWELTYLWSHYEEQARYGGMYDNFTGGKDSGIISRRGAGKSFYKASNMARLFTVGVSKDVNTNVKGVLVAYEKEYLNRDGTLNKFVNMIDFLVDTTQFPSARHKNSIGDMNWVMGYQDADSGVIKGTKNEVLGISAKDNPDKVRGKRSTELVYEEFGVFPKFIETWTTSEYNVREGDFAFGSRAFVGCVCAGTKVRTNEGVEVNIEDIKQSDGILGYDMLTDSLSKEPITYMQEPAYKECVRLVTNRRILECSIDHPILIRETHTKRTVDYKVGNDRIKWFEYKFVKAGDLIVKNKVGVVICEAPLLNFGQATLFDPYFVGALIGDGSYGFDKTPVLSNCDSNILDYVKAHYDYVVEKEYLTTTTNKVYQEVRIEGICSKLREIGIYGQTKLKKTLPINYKELSLNDSSELLAGLFDTDGSIGNGKTNKLIGIVSSSEFLLQQIQELLNKFGIASRIYRTRARVRDGRKDKNDWFSLNIWSRGDVARFKKYIPIKVSYKISNLDALLAHMNKMPYRTENTRNELLKKVEPIGMRRVYNLTAGNTHTYIANGIVTHNTGGTPGSDFEGAAEIINSPEAHRVYALPNVFDKSAAGRTKTILFLGGYLNRKGFYNKDGVSDVIGALVSILKYRTQIKYNSNNPLLITQVKAEMPIVLQESMMRRDSTIYPVSDLNDAIARIDNDTSHWGKMWIGKLTLGNGLVEYVPDAELEVIKDFPHKDNKLEGAVCIKALPVLSSSGRPPAGRYIAGLDPIDDDESTTMSLVSFYILDLYTDELVFEYTGRKAFADDVYEICRRALLMYNAECNYENNKKGLFKYFSQHNALHLLTDTLDFLKEKDPNKPNYVSNKTKGTHALTSVNAYARRCIRDWLLKPCIIERPDPANPDNIIEEQTFSLYKIPFRALLRELALWNPDGNFDRHSALGMLMLLREDRLRLLGVGGAAGRQEETPADYLGNDPFFEKNYKALENN